MLENRLVAIERALISDAVAEAGRPHHGAFDTDIAAVTLLCRNNVVAGSLSDAVEIPTSGRSRDLRSDDPRLQARETDEA